MNNTQNVHIWKIRELVHVTEDEAKEIYDVMQSEGLIRWSSATNRDIKTSVAYAQFFMANNGSWAWN